MGLNALADRNLNLPEVTVYDSPKLKVTHIVAYVREVSTLTTYTDTVLMLREKVVDFMLPRSKKVKYQGWTAPRTLQGASYYRFTNQNGLDSVSDRYHQYFSWSDWIGLAPATPRPLFDTIPGRYGPSEIWTQTDSDASITVDVTADTYGRRWVPELSGYFARDVDFDRLRLRYDYDPNSLAPGDPMDIIHYSYEIESDAAGRVIPPTGRLHDPCYISTKADVTIIDKKNITLKEAKKWDDRKYFLSRIDEFADCDIPELPDEMQLLVERVNAIDHTKVRTGFVPDHRLAGPHIKHEKVSFGRRLLQMFGL